jgi:ribosomal protein L22
MKKRGFITAKQQAAMKKAYYHNGDPLKYVNIKKIADNLVTKYLQSIKANAHKKMKVDPKSLKPTV